MINVTDVGTVAPVKRKTHVDINPISAGGGGHQWKSSNEILTGVDLQILFLEE